MKTLTVVLVAMLSLPAFAQKSEMQKVSEALGYAPIQEIQAPKSAWPKECVEADFDACQKALESLNTVQKHDVAREMGEDALQDTLRRL